MTDLLEGAAPTPSSAAAPLDADALNALFTEARTTRSFADTPVSDEELAGIWDLAKWAPTAANVQPLRVVYVTSSEGRERLVGYMNDGNKARVASAPAVAVLAVDTRFHEYVPAVNPLAGGLGDALEANPQMREGMGGFNSAIQIGYINLAVRAMGLTAGPMAGFDAAGFDADFFPDGRLHAVLVVNIGHPGVNPWHDRLPRLDSAEVINWA